MKTTQFLVCIAFFVCLLANTTHSQQPSQNENINWVAVWRFVKVANNHQEHFYTSNPTEKQNALSQGYVLEESSTRPDGVAFHWASHSFTGSKAVYRLRMPGNGYVIRLYTTNPIEKDQAMLVGYVYEGIVGYVSTTQQQNMLNVYRCYKEHIGDRFYTTDIQEFQAALNDGYVQETTLGYVMPSVLNQNTPPSNPPPASPTLTSIQVIPSSTQVEIQQNITIDVRAYYSDNSSSSILHNQNVTLSVSSADILSVQQLGVYKGVKAGQSSILATYEGKQHSVLITVTDNVGPIIIITSHEQNQVVTQSPITFTGQVTDPSGISSITVNGQTPQGISYFSIIINLIPGKNTIDVIAKDTLQNTSSVKFILNYEPIVSNPSPPPTNPPTSPPPAQTVFGFLGVQYEWKNMYETQEVIADSYLYIFLKFLKSNQVKNAFAKAKWHLLSSLNLDPDQEDLWKKLSIQEQYTGISSYKPYVVLFEDTNVKLIQTYVRVLTFNPQDVTQSYYTIMSHKFVMQKKSFSFLDEGELQGLLAIEIVNNRYMLGSTSHMYMAKRSDDSVLANPESGQEMFASYSQGSYYHVTRNALDLYELDTNQPMMKQLQVLEKDVHGNLSIKDAQQMNYHMISSVFLQRSTFGKNSYASFLSMPVFAYEHVQTYILSFLKQAIVSIHESQSGVLKQNIAHLPEMDKTFFANLVVKPFVSAKNRKEKYVWAYKALSGLQGKMMQWLEEAQYFLGASEIVDLVKEGKYAVAAIELASEFAGKMVASSLISLGVSGVCTGSTVTTVGSALICSSAISFAPLAYVQIESKTYQFVKYASVKSFSLVFEGLAYLFDEKTSQQISEWIGFDWYLYQDPSSVSSQSSAFTSSHQQTVMANRLEVISEYTQGNASIARFTGHTKPLSLTVNIEYDVEIHVLECAFYDMHSLSKKEECYLRITNGKDISYMIMISTREIPSITEYGQFQRMSQFILEKPILLQPGMYQIELHVTQSGSYDICWLTQNQQSYYRLLGKPAQQTLKGGCVMGYSSSQDLLLIYGLFIMILAYGYALRFNKMRIRY